MVGPAAVPAGHRRERSSFLLGLCAVPAVRRGDHRDIGARVPAGRPGRLQAPARRAGAGDTDTLLVFGLDHMVTGQEAAPEEIEAVRRFLKREGTCLLLGPHHDVGVSDDLERAEHGVPASRRRPGAPPAALRQYTRR